MELVHEKMLPKFGAVARELRHIRMMQPGHIRHYLEKFFAVWTVGVPTARREQLPYSEAPRSHKTAMLCALGEGETRRQIET